MGKVQVVTQLVLNGTPSSDYESLYQKLGIKAGERQAKTGKAGQGEDTIGVFFPNLSHGWTMPSAAYLHLVRNNSADLYDIDWRIEKDAQTIAYIDHEQRISQDFPFEHPKVAINIPCHSHRSNIEQWADRPWSVKATYYRDMPERCFHLTRRSDFKEAICCHAKDFVTTTPVQSTGYGGMLVWKCNREKTCSCREYEYAIEDWVLDKLDKEGLL